MAENFDLIFGQNASQQYAWSDNDYQNGWKTIGSIPPTAAQFDALQRYADMKSQNLNSRLIAVEQHIKTGNKREPNTEYTVGTVLTYDGLPMDWVLECIVGGISSANDITPPSPRVEGARIPDGTVTWALRKIATYGGLGYRQPSTAYAVGNIAYHASLPTGYYLECTTGGTTSSGDLTISSPSIGDTITDGGVTWTVVKCAFTTGVPPLASALATPRKIELTGKATGSTTFDGTSNANINVTAVTADTASKLAGARTISIGGNATGSANFDGSSDVTINATVNQAAHANNADTAKKVVAVPANNTSAVELVSATVADNDFFRIIAGGSGTNKGYVAIDTADDGDEPIYVRQYTGTFANNVRTATLLDANGNTSFPGNVKAGSFTGPLNGNATTATTAATANKGTWKGKNDNRWYQMAFSLDDEFDWQSAGAFQYNPASNVLKVGTVQGNVSGNAGSANVGKALQVFDDSNNAINSTFHWVGQSGQPPWVWGSNDVTDQYVYNPANFRVSYANNANGAVNADKLDGLHASDLYRYIGGHGSPVLTDIFDRAGTIDLTGLSAADKARHKTYINKQNNVAQNLWNDTTGIHAYGGDADMSNGYARGTLKLTQNYTNFDKILVVACNDDTNCVAYRIWDTWELSHAFSSCFAFDFLGTRGLFWIFYGTQQHGTRKFAWSTDTVLSCREQNAGIIAIYGIKY